MVSYIYVPLHLQWRQYIYFAYWSMGPVKKRYIHYKKAGDEFLVRTVSGIYSLTSFFFFLQLILSSKTIQKK